MPLDINPYIAAVVAAKRRLGVAMITKNEALDVFSAAEHDLTEAQQAMTQATLRAVAEASAE